MARRWRDAQQARAPRLTRDEFEAGVPCPGCGLPLVDGYGMPRFERERTPEQQADYEREQARWEEQHGECKLGRWSTEGSLAMHCWGCCPPPPLSQEQREAVESILGPVRSPERRASLDVWEATLTCSHTVRATAHHSGGHPHGAQECPQCGGELFGVIAWMRIGPLTEVEPEPGAALRRPPARQPSKAALRKRLREVEEQAAALRAQLAAREVPGAGK